MERKSFNDVLKERERLAASAARENEQMKLDDAKRVKVLSPGRLVFKRFIRNKLAIFGACVLAFMFLFAFVAPLFYPYSQTQTFFKFDYVNSDYATASMRTDYTSYTLDSSVKVDSYVQRNMTSSVSTMEKARLDRMLVSGEGGEGYVLEKLGKGVYTLSLNDGSQIAAVTDQSNIGSYNKLTKTMEFSGEDLGDSFVSALDRAIASGTAEFSFGGQDYVWTMVKKMNYTVSSAGASVSYTAGALGAEFEEALFAAIEDGATEFSFGGQAYAVVSAKGTASVYTLDPGTPVLLSSVLVLDASDHTVTIPNEVKLQSLLHAYSGDSFTVNDVQYRVENDNGDLLVYSGDTVYGLLTSFVVRDSSGNDTFSMEFKEAAQSAIAAMAEANQSSGSFQYPFEAKQTYFEGTEPILDPVFEADGVTPKMVDTKITIELKAGNYQLTCFQWKHLIDISATPSARHTFGTDTDGMDILARMMYGGRISLIVGFIVVILETALGVVMGGLAGYFGGWVDNLIMRIVDIFYCIPSMPILIIMGSFMDAMKLSAYTRLAYLMAILGILGWASVARLVRGQILSLREQEFMVATEATGIRVRSRIFKHLLPNVMPQLIVTATAGLGSVILTESTLSFLGLGVKHPLATWGTMINSVTASNENIIKYTYIWVPVGALICLTVIAFNFVGDGLRDAFDPKMKR